MASFATKSVLKCGRTSHGRKRAARTHIARTLQNAFRTHIAHVRVCAHVCVCEFYFATHSLVFSKKATKIDEIFTIDLTLCSKCQIDGEDFVIFCGLFRKYEL